MQNHKTIVFLLATLAVAGAARASTWITCSNGKPVTWTNKSFTLRANQIGFPQGTPYANALDSVVSSWSSTASRMDYGIQWNDTSVAIGNGQNEAWWQNTLEASAVTYSWWNGNCELVEADVVFLNTAPYSTSTNKGDLWPYGGPFRPFQTTAMHELGHAQGLSHTADAYSVMGQDWDHIHSQGSTATAYPGEDAVSGSMEVYGKVSGPFEDLAVAHWRRVSANGEYSTHERTRMFAAGFELPLLTQTPEPVYRVGKGQTVELEMTYENLGKSAQNVQVGFYLSADATITVGDPRIGGFSLGLLAPDSAFTSNPIPVTIPVFANGGQTYWLGAIIDEAGAVAEVDEGNNSASVAVYVEPKAQDLEAVAILGPPTVAAGQQQVGVLVTVDSFDGSLAGSFAYEVRLSADASITTANLLVGTGSSAALGQLPMHLDLPATLLPGTYYWGLIVKPAPGEVNTANNSIAGGLVTVASPDLVAQQVFAPDTAEAGATVQVLTQVLNVGSPLSGPYSFELRLSADAIIDVTDTLVFSGFADELGGSLHVETVIVPAGLFDGTYRWGLLVAPAPGETNVANNVVAGPKMEVVGGKSPGDVVAKKITGPKKMKAGKQVKVKLHTDAIDWEVAYAFQIRLSQDPLITVEDLVVASGTTVGDKTSKVKFSPPSLPPGKYYWGATLTPIEGEIATGNNVVAGGKVKVK